MNKQKYSQKMRPGSCSFSAVSFPVEQLVEGAFAPSHLAKPLKNTKEKTCFCLIT